MWPVIVMHSHPNLKPIRILWEHVEEAGSAQLILQSVELILAEMERDSSTEAFDKLATPGHAEEAPVESNNQSILTSL
jgi:hypothetical protein